jgi:hypothetical protein
MEVLLGDEIDLSAVEDRIVAHFADVFETTTQEISNSSFPCLSVV